MSSKKERKEMVHILFGTSLVVIDIFDIPISMIIMALKDSIVKLIKKLYQNVFYVSTILLEIQRDFFTF